MDLASENFGNGRTISVCAGVGLEKLPPHRAEIDEMFRLAKIVFHQPETEEDLRLAKEAMDGCPVEAIGNDNPLPTEPKSEPAKTSNSPH